jgi:hypothetical protein
MQKLHILILLALAAQTPARRVHVEKRTQAEEVVQSEIATPDEQSPKDATPEIATSDEQSPKDATPEVATPEVATPEVATPEVVTPEVATPEDEDHHRPAPIHIFRPMPVLPEADDSFDDGLYDPDAEAEDTAEDKAEEPEGAYYYNHEGEWEDVVPEFQKDFTQVFEVAERNGFFGKKYRAWLKEELDDETMKTTRKSINARVMEITPYFWTMHSHKEAIFKNEVGEKVGDYIMYHPRYFARRWTWRVAKKNNRNEVLFTIQKRLYSDHCKILGWFSCRPVLKIYRGHRGDKSTLIYYGVGDKDLEEPDFKFYHARNEYKENRWQWVAKVDHKKTKKAVGSKASDWAKDEYKVKVKAGKDAALLLLATACLDVVGDSTRAANEAADNHFD